ncbi:MAG: YveK family protein [Aristaeellaceae bacterium]
MNRTRAETAARAPVSPAGMQQPEAEDAIDLVEMMYRLLGRWKLILCLGLALALAAGAYTVLFVTPMYEATSTIYVLSRSDSAINMSDLQIGTALTKDYIKVFSMWEVHEKVISNLNLPYSCSQMRSRLSVVNDADTRMLDITFASPSPEEAAAVANEYARVGSAYIAETMSTDKPNIMSVAQAPSSPVSPNRTKNMLLGFLLGAVLGVGIVIVQMLLDDKYKTAEDIQKYAGLATLAIVPLEDGYDIRPGKGRREV